MLADYQQTLARLLVDAALRAAHARGELGEALALAPELAPSPAELASLQAIEAAQLERVAASLAHKRRRSVEATVPHSARVWPELGARYLELLADAPARTEDLDPAIGPGASELTRWLPRLSAAARADSLAPAWTADLLALELARACAGRDLRARTLLCRYPAHRALAALDAGWLGIELEVEPCEYLVEPGRLRVRGLEPPG